MVGITLLFHRVDKRLQGRKFARKASTSRISMTPNRCGAATAGLPPCQVSSGAARCGGTRAQLANQLTCLFCDRALFTWGSAARAGTLPCLLPPNYRAGHEKCRRLCFRTISKRPCVSIKGGSIWTWCNATADIGLEWRCDCLQTSTAEPQERANRGLGGRLFTATMKSAKTSASSSSDISRGVSTNTRPLSSTSSRRLIRWRCP
jgi:hypothetical protein